MKARGTCLPAASKTAAAALPALYRSVPQRCQQPLVANPQQQTLLQLSSPQQHHIFYCLRHKRGSIATLLLLLLQLSTASNLLLSVTGDQF